MAAADGMVNTTPLGMANYPGMAVPADLLRPDLWVADIVYFPLETELLREARARGCRTMSGGGMAVFQAVGAFRLFTGLSRTPSGCSVTSARCDTRKPGEFVFRTITVSFLARIRIRVSTSSVYDQGTH